MCEVIRRFFIRPLSNKSFNAEERYRCLQLPAVRLLCFALFLLPASAVMGQTGKKLAAAMEQFNKDNQLRFASVGFYVVNAATGAEVLDQQGLTGLATASTEKIVTAATAFEVLGKDYSYTTRFGILERQGKRGLYIEASGDPTLGSWRWESTKESVILDRLKAALKEKQVSKLDFICISQKNWSEEQGIPDGWIWQDLGQYYGAGARGLNWRENQFDLVLQSGATEGSQVKILRTIPRLYNYEIVSEAIAAGPQSSDNSYLYYPSDGRSAGVLKGTIPSGKSSFTISGSIYDPAGQLARTIQQELKDQVRLPAGAIEITDQHYAGADWLFTHQSPLLSKIIYWFLRKSINLYGEALLKTVGLQQKGAATTDNGIEAIQEYWKDKGIDKEELHLYDGSGLSPQNRITPHAQVAILRYSRDRPWFPDFYEALPLYNDMKMKSGTINRVKGYTGYQKSRDGNTYIFSMLINNYNGSQYALIRKMYKVLDELK